jgi:hypothetical protein
MDEISNGAVLFAQQLYLENDDGDVKQLHENVDISDLGHRRTVRS